LITGLTVIAQDNINPAERAARWREFNKNNFDKFNFAKTRLPKARLARLRPTSRGVHHRNWNS